jgi:undecaprenyl-diphosphatase
MNILYYALSGIVQGLTEFLPISSSGHLIILPWIFGLETHPLAFDIILHFGTFFAIVIYFRKEWVRILREERKLFWYIAAATVPLAVFGLMIGKGVEEHLRNPMFTAFTLGVFGLALYLSELYGKKDRSLKEITLKAALLIGLAQVLAIMPGVSRSGITITAALLLGMNRESSVRFAFLLGAPIIFAAACYSMTGIGTLSGILTWQETLTGFILSFASSMIAIHFLLNYVRNHSFAAFTVYRLLLSLFIIIALLAG